MPVKRVERKGVVRWQVYGQRGGRRVYVGTFDSEREAKSADRRHVVVQEQIAAGELPPELDLRRTFADAAAAWIDSLAARGSRSLEQYKVRLKLYIEPGLGPIAIARIGKANVMRWRDDLARRFSANTVNGALTCLSSAFSFFVDQQWLQHNPCHGVASIESPDRMYEWIKTREEMTKLLVQCPRNIRELVTVALGTGMRLDEIIHLHWADVDIERRLITVHRGRQGTTKSGRARHVPILDSMLAFLRALALQRDGATLVFPGEHGKPRSKPGVRVPFKQAAARAGLSPKLRFHDLRHTFASHWVIDGGDIFRLSKILGHSSVVITQRTYAHLVPEMWERDYHRVTFTIPEQGTVYGLTRRASPRAKLAIVG